jgi:hypothetical protein
MLIKSSGKHYYQRGDRLCGSLLNVRHLAISFESHQAGYGQKGIFHGFTFSNRLINPKKVESLVALSNPGPDVYKFQLLA